MESVILGLPRIGKNRELKFATEKFFKNEISAQESENTAKTIRLINLKLLKQNNINNIHVGDFSFYDNVLDAAVLFNVLPQRFNNLDCNELKNYFAIARGVQEKAPLALRKWFTTNYHYLVPEVDNTTIIKRTSEGPIKFYKEALNEGLKTIPSVIGPFTLLKLTKFHDNLGINNIKEALVNEYVSLLKDAENHLIAEFSLQEPYLVCDLSNEDIELFNFIYNQIFQNVELKLNLITHFGDIRDIYSEVIKYDFNAIALDFIEGSENFNLIKTYGFNANTKLWAGVINGRGIWRNNYQLTIETLKNLQNLVSNEVLVSTACSLLHVPFTTASEQKLPSNVLNHFAFAVEKVAEVAEIANIITNNLEVPVNNKELFATARFTPNSKLNEKIQNLTSDDFVRLPLRKERQAIQKKALNLPILPTTTIGSFPQTAELRHLRKQFKNAQISQVEYETQIKQQIADCISLQEKLDIDVLVHGEFERNDMVEYFGQNLNGYVFTENGWLQSYGTRCVKPPVIWGDVTRNNPITVATSSYAQSLTSRPVKGMLTGPVTIYNWSFPREDISAKDSIYQIALAIKEEVEDLEKANIKVIQIDEAALKEKLPIRKCDWHNKYLDFAVKSFNLVSSGVQPSTQIHTHMCYSDFTEIIKDIDNMDADVISFEASRSSFEILDRLEAEKFETEVGAGIYDIHSPNIPSCNEIKNSLEKIITKLDLNSIWVNPDCGLKTRQNSEVIPSLTNMVQAAKELRKNYSN